MKILTIGTDTKLFENDSAVRTRAMQYASKVEEYHIIVHTLSSQNCVVENSGNFFLYPTRSVSCFFYPFDAYRLGKKIVKSAKLTSQNTIISTQDPFESGWVGYKLKKKFGLPLQFQIHTDFLSPYFKNSFLNRIRVILAKFLIPKADSLRVVSSVILDSIRSEFPKLKAKIDILPIFVDINKIENIASTKGNVKSVSFKFDRNIFMYSRLTKEKRFDIALEVYKKVHEKNPDIGLVIFGSGPEEENIKKIIKNLGLSEKVDIKRWVNNTEIIPLFHLWDIFLLTSEFEGYGMTLIEAGASGCPIVTTKVGIAKTDLFKNGENASVCEVGDVECLSNSIIELLSSKEKRELYQSRMRDSIRGIALSQEQYVASYIGLLEKTLKTAHDTNHTQAK